MLLCYYVMLCYVMLCYVMFKKKKEKKRKKKKKINLTWMCMFNIIVFDNQKKP